MKRLALRSSLVIALGAILAGTFFALDHQRVTPASMATAADVTTVPVTRQQHNDERTVPVAFTISPAKTLKATRGGVVTQNRCRVGKPITSGSRVPRVDETPILALHTTVPLFRDLTIGSRGRDVRAVQRELRRLGYNMTITGTYTWTTAAAVKNLKSTRGWATPTGQLSRGDLVWMPRPALTPSACPARLGTTLSPGQNIAESAGTLRAVRVTRQPTQLAPGPRTLTLFGQTATAPRSGTITDSTFLTRVTRTTEYAAAREATDDTKITATLALKTPIDTIKVPPTALFALDGDTGCIQTPDGARKARIVGSGLGASLITVTGAPPERVLVGRSITASTC